MLTFTFSGSIAGETSEEIADLFHRLVDNAKLDQILAEIQKQGIDQEQVNQIFEAVTAQKARLDASLTDPTN